MKTIKTLLAVCLLATATTASAQFANGNAGSKKSSSASVVNTSPYSRFYVSYNPLIVKPDFDGAENTTLTGFTFGYTKGISVSKSLPLFVEVGARLNYGFKSENSEGGNYGDDDNWDDDYYDYFGDPYTEDTYETKTTYMGVVVPINFAYKWTSASSPLSITPFLGLTLKGNIIAKKKMTYTNTYDGPFDEEMEENVVKYDLFDKKDVGKDGQWKRFQAGWQIGVGVDYKQLYVGFHYGSDFNEICKKTKTSNWGVSVGYNF